MNSEKQKRLRDAGWSIGNAEDFLEETKDRNLEEFEQILQIQQKPRGKDWSKYTYVVDSFALSLILSLALLSLVAIATQEKMTLHHLPFVVFMALGLTGTVNRLRKS